MPLLGHRCELGDLAGEVPDDVRRGQECDVGVVAGIRTVQLRFLEPVLPPAVDDRS
jgi:hypothetical protein